MDEKMEFLNTAPVRITPERLSGLQRVATIESVGSSTVSKGHASPTERSKSCWQIFAWGRLRHVTSKRLPASRDSALVG